MCGKVFHQNVLEIDHIKPIAKGGKTTIDNLQTLCHDCNVKKGATYEE
ncbi:MAG: HNH endonuclease [Clostridia bacterium]|nr:HNH endonuclease [Clostridia bacterium]